MAVDAISLWMYPGCEDETLICCAVGALLGRILLESSMVNICFEGERNMHLTNEPDCCQQYLGVHAKVRYQSFTKVNNCRKNNPYGVSPSNQYVGAFEEYTVDDLN